jgi:hypothetical protein
MCYMARQSRRRHTPFLGLPRLAVDIAATMPALVVTTLAAPCGQRSRRDPTHATRERLPRFAALTLPVHAFTVRHRSHVALSLSHSGHQKSTTGHASASAPSAPCKYHPIAARAPNHWESIPIVPAISVQPMASRYLGAITRLLAASRAVGNKSRSTKPRFLPLGYRNGPRDRNDPRRRSDAAAPHRRAGLFSRPRAQIRLCNYTLGVELQFRHHILLISCIPTASS